jgi:hypothetical protein
LLPIKSSALARISELAGKIEMVLKEQAGKPADLALRRFGLGLSRGDDRDAVVDFTVALEAVLLRDKIGSRGIGGRFADNGKVYLASSVEGRRTRRRELHRLYETRKALVHGGSAEELVKALTELPEVANSAREVVRATLTRALTVGWPTQMIFDDLRSPSRPTA